MLTMSLRRWGAWAIVADGLVWLAYGLITLEFAPSYGSATRFIDYVAVGLYSGGLLLLAVALAAIHARQTGRAGLLFERVAFLVAIAGATLAGLGDLVEDGLRFAAAGWVFFGGMLLLVSLGIAYPLGGLWSNWGGTVVFGLVWITLGGVVILDKSQTSNVDIHR